MSGGADGLTDPRCTLGAVTSPTDCSIQCGYCGGRMRQEHAHYRCVECGRRDACCEGVY